MTTIEQERPKYQRIWALDEYRQASPGQRLISKFAKVVPYQREDTLLDLGCGTGRAGLELSKLGLKVTLLDLCESSRDEAAKSLPFVLACVWELPADLPVFDWVFCTDVLEHIPTEHVDETISNMARVTKRGVFLQIAMYQDSYGHKIHETLHLTVKPSSWWKPKLEEYFKIVYATEMSRSLIVYAEKK